jgi:peptidoglycan/xylan/chitin deacetylase (PgdA/CDA1 family)
MKAVMYHYVRTANPEMPNFRYLHIDNFRRQLDHFEKAYGFVTQDEWAVALKTGDVSIGAGKIILTFDDAMSCHHTHVFPELIDRGLWGIFYVPAQPYLTKRMLDVHRVHVLCGSYDGEQLFEVAQHMMTDAMISFEKRAEFRQKTYTSQTNKLGVSEFKRLINYFCLEQFRAGVLDDISKHLGASVTQPNYYVSEQQLADMHGAGMTLGSHTVSHPVMSKLSRLEQDSQITQSFGLLKQMGVTGPKTYCHPYGGFHSFDANTVALLDAHDVSWSFNVESRDITNNDLATGRQHLPRFDCNEFPHGTAS